MMKPIAVAGIAVVAAAAGGVGSYLAVRHAIGLVPETVSSAAAEPAAGVAEPTPTSEAEPEPAAAGAVVDVEPAAANPPPAARPAPRREPAAPASRREPGAPAPRREPAAPAEASSTPTGRAPAPAARRVEAEPDPRPRPVAAPVTTPPRPEPEPEPASNPGPGRPADGARARAATSEPPSRAPGLPVVAGWARAGGPDTAPTEGAAARTEREPPSLAGTGLLDARAVDPVIAPDPWPAFDELQIAAESVIGIQVETAVSTRTARLEDPVEARVVRDVLVGPRVAIPSGARVRGSVVLVEPGGRLREASRLGVRFHTLVLDDGAEVTLSTETVYREGKSPGGDSVAKIGGAAVAGSILGAIFGGERGAAIGGSIGAAGGTAAALNGEAEPATLPPGSRLTVRLSRPASVTVPR